MRNRILVASASLVLAVVALIYWPVLQGGFVWDDLISFVWNDWLIQGDKWKTYIFRGFNFWDSYFRPLVVGLLVSRLMTRAMRRLSSNRPIRLRPRNIWAPVIATTRG